MVFDLNRGKTLDNSKSMSSHIATLPNAQASFEVGLQELSAVPNRRELVQAALTMKDSLFCSNMVKELGFGMPFESVKNILSTFTSAPPVAGN